MNLLLINPWIYDFSAYDLWAKPLGLLYIASVLRKAGFRVSFIDCMDRHHWSLRGIPLKEKEFGCGEYPAEEVQKPECLKFVLRKYKRYGIPVEGFLADLKKCERPSAIVVTSRMTYWYPGVVEVIKRCREIFPDTPVLLGGTYPTLMSEHAKKHSGADIVVTGEGELQIFDVLSDILGEKVTPPAIALDNLDTLPYPALDVYSCLSYGVVQSTRGCPFRCSYCASKIISPRFRRRSPEKVAEELRHWEERFQIKDFAFYDDALLVEPEKHFIPMMEHYLSLGGTARFHTPNGLDFTSIDDNVAKLMKRANFRTLRLSLETASTGQLERLNRRADSVARLQVAVEFLRRAGFSQREIGVYLLVGLPGQTLPEIKESIDIVLEMGANPRLAEYSPIPRTTLWREAVEIVKPLDIAEEPLYHNNSVYFRLLGEYKDNTLSELRNYIYAKLKERAPNEWN